eukprot:3521680-Amphidinium_carterae.1
MCAKSVRHRGSMENKQEPPGRSAHHSASASLFNHTTADWQCCKHGQHCSKAFNNKQHVHATRDDKGMQALFAHASVSHRIRTDCDHNA